MNDDELTPEEKMIALRFGVTPEQYLATKRAEQARRDAENRPPTEAEKQRISPPYVNKRGEKLSVGPHYSNLGPVVFEINLRGYRETKGVSIAAVARTLGISLAEFERLEAAPRLSNFKQAAIVAAIDDVARYGRRDTRL